MHMLHCLPALYSALSSKPESTLMQLPVQAYQSVKPQIVNIMADIVGECMQDPEPWEPDTYRRMAARRHSPRRRLSSCCPEADRAMAAAGIEAALPKAPAPSSCREGPPAAKGGACIALCSTLWLSCLANGVGSCCADRLADGLCNWTTTHGLAAPSTLKA